MLASFKGIHGFDMLQWSSQGVIDIVLSWHKTVAQTPPAPLNGKHLLALRDRSWYIAIYPSGNLVGLSVPRLLLIPMVIKTNLSKMSSQYIIFYHIKIYRDVKSWWIMKCCFNNHHNISQSIMMYPDVKNAQLWKNERGQTVNIVCNIHTLQNRLTWPDLVSEWRVHPECFHN